MKKIIIALLALALLQVAAWSQTTPLTLGQVNGVNSFLGGQRYGHKWPAETLAQEVKLKRFYIGNGEASEKNGIYAIDRTWKGWAWKESLLAYKSQGVKVILATAGGFYDQDAAGQVEKRLPLNNGDDMHNPESWYRAARVCHWLATLYGNNINAPVDANELQKTTTGTGTTRWATEPKAGQNLIYAIDPLQETPGWGKNWNGVTRVADDRAAAIGWYECYKAIRQADPSMKVLFSALVHNDTMRMNRLRNEVKAVAGVYPEQLPNVILNFHHYTHTGMIGQARTNGISPEQAHLNIAYWDALGPWMVTEFGYDDVTGSTQEAPLITGLNGSQSAWEYNLRTIAWYSTGKNCTGIVVYQIRNEADGGSGLYQTCGLYTSTYAAKPGTSIFLTFLTQVKNYELPSVHTMNGSVHVFTFRNGGVLSYAPDGKMQTGQVAPPPPPPASVAAIGFSTVSDRSNFTTFTTTTIAPGPLFIEARSVTAPVYFTLKTSTGTVLNTRAESIAPYDAHGGQPWDAMPGTYTLTVKDKNAEVTITFTVSDMAPPPPPPAKETVTEVWIEAGKAFHKTSAGNIWTSPVTKEP